MVIYRPAFNGGKSVTYDHPFDKRDVDARIHLQHHSGTDGMSQQEQFGGIPADKWYCDWTIFNLSGDRACSSSSSSWIRLTELTIDLCDLSISQIDDILQGQLLYFQTHVGIR